jgi:type VI secretion system secreted protein Hcp
MAETVHLFLKANGKDIKGESTQKSLGREGSIECVAYEQAVTTAREAATGVVTGRRQYGPLKVVKRVEGSSPLLVKALVNNEKIEASFKFFRPNPAGDGTTEQFYTVALKDAYISAMKQLVHETINPATSGDPPLEEVSFVFKTISWTYTKGGITHEDSWEENK